MKKILKVGGMHCASCSKIIEMELEGKVNSSKIDHVSGKAIIDFDDKKFSEKQIIDLIIKAGYKVE